jgi:5-methyltetrahydropteroyltriglutamate--homocysteine methyltransferase
MKPMTMWEYQTAQKYTKKDVKAILTGPNTMLNWAFPRKDVSMKEQAYQIALAVRDEVTDLQNAGCKHIQIDDPTVREGLPLKKEDHKEYMDWCIKSFRLCSGSAKPEVQVSTHLC